jgi:hypothetical protein
MIHAVAANAAVTRILADSFGAANAFSGRRANGTAASPTGLVADDVMCQLTGTGYNSAAAYGAVCGDVRILAAETHSGTAAGSYITLRTTAKTTTTPTERVRIDDAGNVGVGVTSSFQARLDVLPQSNSVVAANLRAGFGGNAGLGFGSSDGATSYGTILVTSTAFNISGTGSTPIALNASGGGVGIGTAAPGSALQINGPTSYLTFGTTGQYSGISLMGTVFATSASGYNLLAGSTDTTLYLNSPAALQFRIGNVTKSQLRNDGNWGYLGHLVLNSGSGLYLNGSDTGSIDADWYLAKDASHNINLSGSSSGTRALRVLDAANSSAVRFAVEFLGSVVVGAAALATNATEGFLYIPTCAGAPTGVPTAKTGRIAMIYDTTNNFFYFYNGGWKKSTVYA